ncbi:MAG: heparin lyase I family protein, partial [Deltaproteobacteria bacterium]|nr:heparin lyase I family protein [Deltaproteobacteria bacterium]
QVFSQWHHSGSSGAPPVRLVLGCSAADCGASLPDTTFFIVNGRNLWTTQPLQRGVWHDFVIHVKWSASASVGFVELWQDGVLVVPKTSAATLFSGQSNYLKLGLYRDEATSPTQVLFHDNFVMGTSLADVQPPPEGSPDAGGISDPSPGLDAATSPDAVGVGEPPDSQTPADMDAAVQQPGADAEVAPPERDGSVAARDADGNPRRPDSAEAQSGDESLARWSCSSAAGGAGGALALALTMLAPALSRFLRRKKRRW